MIEKITQHYFSETRNILDNYLFSIFELHHIVERNINQKLTATDIVNSILSKHMKIRGGTDADINNKRLKLMLLWQSLPQLISKLKPVKPVVIAKKPQY